MVLDTSAMVAIHIGPSWVMATGESASWPISVIAGYALPALFSATDRQGPLAYALTAALVAFTWLFTVSWPTYSSSAISARRGLSARSSLRMPCTAMAPSSISRSGFS